MQITIALTKGRILKETLPMLALAGIEPLEDISASRKLLFDTSQTGVRLLVLRGSDVPTYVQFGAADLGVAGKDTLLEHGGDGLYDSPKEGRIRVATKYVNIARRFYAEQGRQVDIIKLYGAMELAPIMALADEIVDIVDTGNTLKANGLEARDVIADVSSRIIVNKAAMKMKHQAIQKIVEDLREAVG